MAKVIKAEHRKKRTLLVGKSVVKKPTVKKAHVIKKKAAGIGSSFEDFLKQEGSFEETTALAVKRVLTWQIEQAMASQGVTKANMAQLMKTSRSQLDRLLDPDNDKVQLDTLHRAAMALGKRMFISLEDATA